MTLSAVPSARAVRITRQESTDPAAAPAREHATTGTSAMRKMIPVMPGRPAMLSPQCSRISAPARRPAPGLADTPDVAMERGTRTEPFQRENRDHEKTGDRPGESRDRREE